MKNSILYISLILVLSIVYLQGCAPQRKNPMSNVFHNTTAHYNAYFIANEKIKEVETSLKDGYEWNYNRILPVYIEFDTTDTAPFKDQLKDALEKAAIAIQRHPGSAWEDDSYILVGKSRYYGFEFADAVETYKYVNTHSKNDNARHQALVELMKTFIKNNELRNAEEVSDFLKKEKLNKKNLKNLYLNRAYLYQQRENLSQLVGNLVKAEELIKEKKLKARINFIIGQIYQELGFESNAYEYYRNVLKSNPSYELSFYTRLNIAQVTKLTNSNDSRRVRKYYDKLLSDQKNLEYRDKIYYEIGNFELKQGNLDEAIDAYKASAASSINNKRQKAYSFLQLGKIYFDSLGKYELAKSYYDSTISVLPTDEENYDSIKERQEILGDFVENINIIRKNDSLLNLAYMDSTELSVLLNGIIASKEVEQEEKKKEERKARRQGRSNLAPSAGDIISLGGSSGGTWYFYNSSAVSRGSAEFKRIWGDRPLEDNWRRSEKQLSISNPEAIRADLETRTSVDFIENTVETQSTVPSLSAMMATIPFDTATQNKMNGEIEEAHYNLGKIYHFQLFEDPKAVETFEILLDRYDESVYEPELLYLLFLIADETKRDTFKSRLIADYPNSIYAKLAVNPNYREESNAITAKLQKIYAEAYRYYEAGDYRKSLSLVDNALREYPDNEFTDNVALLKVMIIGKTQDIYKYQFELSTFAKTYSESDLQPYVDDLIKAAEDYQLNLVNSAKAKYSTNLDKKHLYAIVYEAKDGAGNKISAFVSKKLEEMGRTDLTPANLIFEEGKGVIIINEFSDKESSLIFKESFKSGKSIETEFKELKLDQFVITDKNFNTLYQTKEVDTYLKFYRSNY
ncbi:MAG: methyltransferase [Cyclobacteriaceae bacterium]